MAQHRLTLSLADDGTQIASQEVVRNGAASYKFDQVVPANTADHEVPVGIALAELETLLIAAGSVSGAPVDATVRTNAGSAGAPDDTFPFSAAGFVAWAKGTGAPNPLTVGVTSLFITTGPDPVRVRVIALQSTGVGE